MSEITLTLICCYNDLDQFNNFAASLKNQTCKYNLIPVDNIGNKNFNSCAAAYNSVIDQVNTKYLIFSHQDILLNDNNALEKFLKYFEQININDMLGVAGVKFDTPGLFANLNNAGDFKFKNLMQVDVFDECFFGGYSEHFKINKFDEILCDNWHLYAVDMCLKNLIAHNKNYICDINIKHLSPGKLNFAFRKGFYKLLRHYKNNFKFIRTCCDHCKTKFIPALYHLINPYRFVDLLHILKVKILRRRN